MLSGSFSGESRPFLEITSPCPRRGRREPKASGGRGAARAVAATLVCLFAASWKVVLVSGGSPSILALRLDESGLVRCQALHLSRRYRFSSGLRRPLLGQGEVKICLRAGGITAISDLMKLGHLGAVVLGGWILLAPSVDCARRGLERETPLSEWERGDHFASRTSCEDYRSTVIEAEKSDSGNVYVERYSYSICVADDDPRLKEPNP